MDGLKISHLDSKEVTNLIGWLRTKYTNLMVHWGKTHDYLGMDLDLTTPGVLTVSMTDYTNKIINEFPENIAIPTATPTADHLFKVQESDKAFSTTK